MSAAPFFIVGCGRSGTTLLKTILSAHPALYVMPETFFFKNVYPKVQRYGEQPWRSATGWWLADVGVTPEGIKPFVEEYIEKGCSKECAVLRSIFDFHSQSHDVLAIGEKTPDHVNYIEQIRQFFPNARIIQIIRDPRAVVCSFRKVKVGSSAIADIVDEWAKTEYILESNANTKDFFALRYEDLVSEPETKLQEVFEFLGVEWTTSVLQFHSRNEAGYAPEQDHHANTKKPLFIDSIDTWRRELTQNEINLIEWALKEGMKRQGYSLEGGDVTFPSLQMKISRLVGITHKAFVRFPRQRVKAVRARLRLARKGLYL